jgi:predicted transcriptional regulator
MSAIRVRRDRHDIAAEILEIARVGLIRTHVMYKAKLSFGQLREYVPMLLEKGLLENLTVVKHRQFTHVLKTTEKGQKFLESLKSLELLWLP